MNVTTMKSKTPSSLLKSDGALGTYLDELLHQATQVAEIELPTISPVVDTELLPETLLAKEVLIEDEVVAVIEDEASIEVVVDIKADDSQDNVIAIPADMFPIQCLMFKVGGNLLSIPLTELTGIVKWSNNMTRLPQEPDWVLGVMQYRDQNIRVLDSAGILQIKVDEPAESNHILVLGEEGWGITCDQLGQIITLEYEDVQWLQKSSNKRVFGTIRQSLASLLNPQGIVQNLQTGL